MSMENENEQVMQPAETPAVIVGVVSDCKKLNIRKAPNKDADVVCVVTEDTELTIAPHSVDKPWYRVTTTDGVKGFCMREFVTISR